MVTSEYYHDVWHGTYDGDDIDVIISRAEIVINAIISPSGYSVDTVPQLIQDAVKKSICAQADSIISLGGIDGLSEPNVASATLGRFSYSISDGSSPTALCPMAQTILFPTGLLYRGVTAR